MTITKDGIEFQTQACVDKYDALNPILKYKVKGGRETYTPRCIVLYSYQTNFEPEELDYLISMAGFQLLKRVETFNGTKMEIIFDLH